MIVRFVAGCLRRLVVLAVMVASLALGWHHRDRLLAAWHDFRTETATDADTPSPELADAAERKLASLAAANGPERVALRQVEIQSLVDHRLSNLLPASVRAPRVRLGEGRVRLAGRVPTRQFAGAAAAEEILAFLPDTTELSAAGQLVPLRRERVALEVLEMSAARIPLPERMVPQVLASLGLPVGPPLSPNMVALPLPPGAETAYISGDSLVLLARDRGAGAIRRR